MSSVLLFFPQKHLYLYNNKIIFSMFTKQLVFQPMRICLLHLLHEIHAQVVFKFTSICLYTAMLY